MRLRVSLSLLALSAAASAVAQTSAPTTPVHAHHAAATAGSTLPKNIPPTHGLVKIAYSLRYADTKIGTGELATAPKFYTVNYTGWLAADGKKFDASADHGGPATFIVGMHKIIPGWDTGFTGMRIGGKRRLFIPWQLAYGENGSPVRPGHPQDIPPKSDLIFDIELVSISDKPPTPARPTAPPAGQPGAGSAAPGSAAPGSAAPGSAAPGSAAPPPAGTPPPASNPQPGTPPPAAAPAPATPPPAPQK